MSTVHVLDQSNGEYRCVIHFPVPGGSNSAGFTWKAVALSAGIAGATRLVVGTGPGQITAAEQAQIVAGDVVEFETTLRAESGGLTGALLAVTVDGLVANAITDFQAKLAREFKWYGATRP